MIKKKISFLTKQVQISLSEDEKTPDTAATPQSLKEQA